MNKRQIVASLNSIANELDTKGLFKEANEVTEVMVRISQSQYPLSEQEIANSAIANARSKFTDGDKRGALKELGEAGAKIGDENVKGQLLKVYKDYQTSNPPIKMPKFDLEIPMPYDKFPGLGSGSSGEPKKTPKPDSDSLGPKIPGLGSKPGKSDSSTPKNSEGLSRWVNKAENIYSAWVSKGARPSTDAEGLIQDIIDYMEKVKLNMRPSLHSAADYKIDKVKTLKASIASTIVLPGFSIATPYGAISGVKPYGDVSGFPGKGVNPFTYDPSKRLTGTQLDYQARNEGKSY